MATIPDHIFISELEKILKKQKIKIKERSKIILSAYQKVSIADRDDYLEQERAKIPKKPRLLSEDQEQINLVEWFRKTYPGVDIMAIWNGGTRSNREKTKQLLMGVLPGAADLFIPDWNLWIEMKKTKRGVLSKGQAEFGQRRIDSGHSWFVAHGAEEAKKFILIYGENKS